ncbi:MAG: ATP-NAD kinase family protein [Cellvibrionaceae bacterium]|nr:ATP-NAD kinase family protein [Cellvibrionaceae bacterium]
MRIQAMARAGELPLTAATRAQAFLQHLKVPADCALTVVTVPGPMGGDVAAHAGLAVELTGFQPAEQTTAADTQIAAQALVARRVDLLIFVGGDGTARDVCRVIPPHQAVLGVPAGVKMHSGVYAINPQAAGELVSLLLGGALVNLGSREVRDIDEEAFRLGQVKSRHFGDMLTPEEGRFVQHVKQGGLEVEELVLLDIAAQVREELTEDTLLIAGPGSTTLEVLRNWGVKGTLLGVDILIGTEQVARDVDATTLLTHLRDHRGPVILMVTAIGGQGHIIGRGNQQLTPEVLRGVGRDNLRVIATKTKLKTLEGRPLCMDSGDAQLDRDWQGYIPVITGYADTVLYPLGLFALSEKRRPRLTVSGPVRNQSIRPGNDL